MYLTILAPLISCFLFSSSQAGLIRNVALSNDASTSNVWDRAASKTYTSFVKDFADLDAKDERKPPYSSSTIKRWSSGSYPKFCYDTAIAAKASNDPRLNCAINNLEVYNVTYNDCTQYPWTVCRCSDAQLSTQAMVNAFGRVPPGVRSRVVHVFVVDGSRPDGSIGKSGGSNNDRFIIRGPIDDAAFTHESMHSVDQGFSSSQTFKTAYDGDTCVPDDYSKSSNAEDFAQLGVWTSYDTNGMPIKNYLNRDWTCMANQLAAVKTYAGNAINLKTSKCAARRPNDVNVTPSLDSIVAGQEEPLPPVAFEFEDEW